MSRQRIPDEVLPPRTPGRRRARRATGPEADRLRAEIEAAGWKIVDRGTDFALAPAAPRRPSRTEGDGPLRISRRRCRRDSTSRRRASRRSSSSRRTGRPTSSGRSTASRAHAPDGDVGRRGRRRRRRPSRTAALEAVAGAGRWSRSSGRASGSGQGAALNAGLRRAQRHGRRRPRHERRADRRHRHAARRARSTTRRSRVAGGWGIVSDDLRRFERRAAGRRRRDRGLLPWRSAAPTSPRAGPLDERFRFYRNLDIWWSLVLRDEGEGTPPRRAVASSCRRRATSTAAGRASPEAERDRLSKRNFYRIIDRFGSRKDLAAS